MGSRRADRRQQPGCAHPRREPWAGSLTGPLAALADRLLDAGCVKFGQFTLKSGLQSPIYLDLRQLISSPALLAQVAAAYVDLLSGLEFDRLAALPYAALPIGAAVSLRGGWPMIYPRREAKSYGTGVEIEGYLFRVKPLWSSTTWQRPRKQIRGHREDGRSRPPSARRGGADRPGLGRPGGIGRGRLPLHAVMTLRQMLGHWEHAAEYPGAHRRNPGVPGTTG